VGPSFFNKQGEKKRESESRSSNGLEEKAGFVAGSPVAHRGRNEKHTLLWEGKQKREAGRASGACPQKRKKEEGRSLPFLLLQAGGEIGTSSFPVQTGRRERVATTPFSGEDGTDKQKGEGEKGKGGENSWQLPYARRGDKNQCLRQKEEKKKRESGLLPTHIIVRS